MMKKSSSYWWKVYAELEEIPSTVAPPLVDRSNLASPLSGAWRSLLTLFCQELLYEQQVDYLERCMALSQFAQSGSSPFSKFQKLVLAVIMS